MDTEQSAVAADPRRQLAENVLQTIQRDINVLAEQTSDRMSKRKSLERIQKEALGSSSDAFVASCIFASLSKPLLRAFSDPVEKCRELSISIVTGFTKKMGTQVIPFLPYIVPTLVDRLGQLDIVEPAEELRLLLITLLFDLASVSQGGFAPFVEDTMKILSRSFADTFPEVKKRSCLVAIQICKFNVKPVAYHGDALTKYILPVIQHRHSSVRTLAIEALCESILVEASGLDAAIDALRPLAYDKAAIVRETLYKTAKRWLMELMDRYTYGYKVLPLLLCGMVDEMPKLCQMSTEFVDEVGALYEREWESRIKDEMDYSDGWNHLKNRPRVGSRHLARDNIQKIVAKLVENMSDWTVESRAKSAQILRVFVTFCEDQITGYVGTILPVLYKILASDDVLVMTEAHNVAQVLGTYVDPDATLSHLLPQIAMGGGSSTSYRLGCMRTLHGLLLGADPDRLAPQLPRLIETLSDRDLIQNENILILHQISQCVNDITQKMSKFDAAVAFQIFMILAQLESVPISESVSGAVEMKELVCCLSDGFNLQCHRHYIDCLTDVYVQAKQSQTALANALGVASSSQLYSHFYDAAIAILAGSHTSWTKHSPERYTLETLVLNAGHTGGLRLDTVLPILYSCATSERDFEVRE
eukprot:jgi/Hompol1/6792/HPOL_002333-RA